MGIYSTFFIFNTTSYKLIFFHTEKVDWGILKTKVGQFISSLFQSVATSTADIRIHSTTMFMAN
jgi:hypothetical protein